MRKEEYKLRKNRTREGFLDYAKKTREESKEFFDSIEEEKYPLNKNRTKGSFIETLKKNIEKNKGFYDSCGTE